MATKRGAIRHPKTNTKNKKIKIKRTSAKNKIKRMPGSLHAKGSAKIIKNAGKQELKNKMKRQKKMLNVTIPENASDIINTILTNEYAADYLKKNVSKRALEVIELLSTPKTDEDIADALNMKVNAVRRILNILQGYGVTNYHISKNNNGWLSFGWYINMNKLPTFFDYIKSLNANKIVMNDSCNDYFICRKCFDNEKFVYTFDAAFESEFRCKTCNAQLERIDKKDVENLVSGTLDVNKKEGNQDTLKEKTAATSE
ncbi:MAG: hypothetical protein ACP5TL_01965 [Candidatus Micrarchaeia archaeon]